MSDSIKKYYENLEDNSNNKNNNMSTKYLQFDFKESKFYEYSKEEQDDFKEHTNTVGVVSYRKLAYKGVTGELVSVSVSDSKIGKQLRTTLNDGENFLNCDLPLFDQKGRIKDYAQSLILCLGNMKRDTEYTLFPYHMTGEDMKKYDEENNREVRDKYRDIRRVSIKTDGNKIPWYLSFSDDAKKKIRIPKLAWEKANKFAESETPTSASVKEQTNFILNELARCIEGHLKQEDKDTSSKQEDKKPKNKVEKKSDNKSDKITMEDLPW